MAGFRAILGLILLCAVSACFSPSYEDCQLTCPNSTACPDGLSCDGLGFCRTAGSTGTCGGEQNPDSSSPVIDANPTDPDAPPGPPDGAPIDAPQAPIDAGIDASQGCTCTPVGDTCCGADTSCDLLAPGYEPVCRAITAPKTQGQVCLTATECAEGYNCNNDPGSATGGSCQRFCASHAACAAPGGKCVNPVGDTTQNTCSTHCDPVTPDACPAAATCVIQAEGGLTWTDCFLRGDGNPNTACTGHDDCKRGLFCREEGATDRCRKYCNKTANTGCSGNTTCTALADGGVFLAGVEIGFCKPN